MWNQSWEEEGDFVICKGHMYHSAFIPKLPQKVCYCTYLYYKLIHSSWETLGIVGRWEL